MRALHVVKTAVGATWAVRQVRELVRLGVDVHVAVPPGPRVDDYRAAGAVVHLVDISLPTQRPQHWRSRQSEIRNLVGVVNPDIIHSHFVTSTMALRFALGRNHPIPRLFQVPGPLHLENAVTARLELSSAGGADRWIASCQWTRDEYVRLGVPASHVSLSYYGSDVDALRPRSPALRSELGLGPSVPIVGMVAYMYAPKRYLGQHRGIKGHEDLIDAMVRVRQSHRDAVAVFVGGAWAGASRYETRVRRYGAARLGAAAQFMGTRDDVRALYPDMTLVVHPSHSENLGGAVESSLLGVPSVATNVGGFPDLIEDGYTGLSVPPKKPQALAKAIAGVIADPASARIRAEAARARAASMCDIRINAREVLDSYHLVLASGRVAEG